MTVNSIVRKSGPFAGNGSASVFPFPFKVFEAEDLLVVSLDTAAGIETELVLDSDYTASLNFDQDSSPGGSITLLAPLATGFNLIISSDQPELQETDLTNGGGFYPEVITSALDGLIIDVQQLREQAERSLRYPISDPPLNAELPPADQRSGQYLFFAEDGSIGISRVHAFAGMLAGTVDGSNCIFTITNAGTVVDGHPTQILVWKNFPQIPGVGYTPGPGANQVTFTFAPELGDILFAQGSAEL